MLLIDIKPSIRLLQGLGIYPSLRTLKPRKDEPEKPLPWQITNGLLMTFTVALTILNIGVCLGGIVSVNNLRIEHGLLSGHTLLALLNLLKNIQCCLTLAAISFAICQQTALLDQANITDSLFREEFAVTVNARRFNCRIYSVAYAVIVTSLLLGLSEIIICGDYGSSFRPATAFRIPYRTLQAAWLVLPVAYFHHFSETVRFWAESLVARFRRKMDAAPDPERIVNHELRFFTDSYINLSDTTRCLDAAFSAYIFITTLCPIIELIVILHSVPFWVPMLTAVGEGPNFEYNRMVYVMLWTTINLVMSVVIGLTVITDATLTNERMASVITPFLNHSYEDREERFQIVRMSQKTHLFKFWGISFWRIFIIRRATLFSIILFLAAYTYITLTFYGTQKALVRQELQFDYEYDEETTTLNSYTDDYTTIT